MSAKRRDRPRQETAAQVVTTTETNGTACAALRRRRAASYRCQPMPCGRRDPLDPRRIAEPSSFGLDADELRDEANRLAALGWALDEVLVRLAVAPRLVTP